MESGRPLGQWGHGAHVPVLAARRGMTGQWPIVETTRPLIRVTVHA